MLLSEAVEAYIARKRLMGRKYIHNAKELRALVRLHPTLKLADVRTAHVQMFLNYRPLSRGTWIGRYKRVGAFMSYWVSRRQLAAFRMPSPRREVYRGFTPYIFTPLQMRTLLARALEIQSRHLSEVAPETFRVLLIFLYATGTWISEALALKWSDINFDNSTIDIYGRVGARREIPIGNDLRRILQGHRSLSQTDLVFTKINGRPIRYVQALMQFRRVRKLVGIRRTDGFKYDLGFNDLRHTFAVTRIVEWYRTGADIELLLPRLAHYMGLFTCTLASRYLPLVPDHFKKQLDQLSGTTRAR